MHYNLVMVKNCKSIPCDFYDITEQYYCKKKHRACVISEI